MKFEDAVKKSIKSFMQGKAPSATNGLSEEGLFYNPEYFDELEETLLQDTPKKTKNKKEDVDADV
mgnify:CR=1 FL=1